MQLGKVKKLAKKVISVVLAAGMLVTGVPTGYLSVQAEENLAPVLSVSFDDGTAEDAQSQIAGTVVGNPEFTEGKSGKAIHLVNSDNREDEARQYVNFGQPEALKFGEGDFTIMLWYKAEASSQTEGAIVSNKYWASGANPGFTIGDMKEGVTFNINTPGSSRKDTKRYSQATDGTWHHIAAVADRTDAGKMTLYIDGIAVEAKDISDLSGSVDVADFLLGASNKTESTKFLAVNDAYMDELKVYKHALTQSQIMELGIKPAAGNVENNRMLKVTFDNETAEDISGKGNGGTIVGEPEFVEGVSGKALHLVNSENKDDEARQYVNFGQPSDLQFGEGNFTIMLWYKAEASSQTEGAIVSNKYWVSGGNPGFTIGDMKEGITFNINTPGSNRKDTGRYSQATDGTWHHIAAVADRTDAGKMTLYIDGIAVDTKDISDLSGSVDVADLLLGASNQEKGTKFLAVNDAYIDEFEVYNCALPSYMINGEVKKIEFIHKIDELKKRVSLMTAGERYSEDAIAAMSDKIDAALEKIKNENLNQEPIWTALYTEYEAFMEGNEADMSFHLISDTHVTSDPNASAAVNFKTALQDMQEINPRGQALVIPGDITQDGRPEELEVYYNVLNTYNPVEDNQTMIALGNHDMRGPNSGIWDSFPSGINEYYNVIYPLYMEHNAKYMPENIDVPYYDRWIGGYHFIVLNSENSPKDTAYLSNTQLIWLEEKLAEGENAGNPAFVIIHQALNDTHLASNNYNGFGNQDAQVKAILKKYPQTVFISGHIHNGLGTAEVMDSPYGTLLDVPSFNYNHNGITGAGTGYEVYVYKTELYLRARDYIQGKWLPEYDVSVKLPTLPVLYKEVEELPAEWYTEESWTAAESVFDEVMPEAQAMLEMTYGNYGAETRFKINQIQSRLQEGLNLLVKSEEERVVLEDIRIKTTPDKTKYMLGEALDLTGMVVEAIYTDGHSEVIEDYKISGYDSNQKGFQNVIVSYGRKKAVFAVTVDTIQGVSKLYGTPFARTTGDWESKTPASNAFDGDVTTFYDGEKGAWLGLELDFAVSLRGVKIIARGEGYHNRLRGVAIQGSNDKETWDTLHTVAENEIVANPDAVNIVLTESETEYKYYRLFGANENYVNVAEVEFFGNPSDDARTALKLYISDLEHENYDIYTEESSDALKTAVQSAKEKAADETLTDEQLKAALAELKEAFRALEKEWILTTDTDMARFGDWREYADAAIKSKLEIYTATAGDYVEFRFEGNGLEMYSNKNSALSFADIYVDGQLTEDNVSLYEGESEGLKNQLISEITDLTYGQHIVRVELAEEFNEKGKRKISIDAFKILRDKKPIEIPEDTTKLEKAIVDAEKITEDSVTPSSWETLKEAIQTAKTVLADAKADKLTQDQVDTAAEALNRVVKDLKPMADFDALKKAIEDAEGKDKSKYTEESVAELMVAISTAKTVLANKEATQKQVDDAVVVIQEAVKGLKEKLSVDLEEAIRQAKEAAQKAEAAKSAAEAALEDAKIQAAEAAKKATDAETEAKAAADRAKEAAEKAEKAKTAEEAAKKAAAEAAENAADTEEDRKTAEAAKTAAEAAKQAAEAAKREAVTAKTEAEAAKSAAQTAQSEAKKAQDASEAAQREAEAAKAAAEEARDAAAQSAENALEAKEAAEAAQKKAVDAQKAAETDAAEASEANEAAGKAKAEAEAAAAKTEIAKNLAAAQANVATKAADESKAYAEKAEAAKKAAEEAAKRAEEARKEAEEELKKVKEEAEKKLAEMQKLLKETAKSILQRCSDFQAGSWYEDYVVDVYLRGYMTGMNPQYFGINETLVRAQFAVILYRMAGEPEVEFKENFADVKAGQFYSDAVTWASEQGIITGYEDSGLFGPNDSITREQMATIMYRYADVEEKGVDVDKILNVFSDEEKVSEFAKEALAWCVEEGIITGKNAGDSQILVPQGHTLRVECAAVISRFCNWVEAK